MGWLTSATEAGTFVVQEDTSKGVISSQRIDYDTPEDSTSIIKYHVHENVTFFGTTTRKVTRYVGLTYAAAHAMVIASGAQSSNYEWKQKQTSVSGFYAMAYVETSSKTTSMQRADASGQYQVTVVETATTVS